MGSKYDNMPILDAHGKIIHRMTPAERAKIFMPFDALKGLQDALRKVEAEAERRAQPGYSGDPFACDDSHTHPESSTDNNSLS